jgi:hypothetical protein
LAAGVWPDVVLFKFTMNKDHQAALRKSKGLVRTKQGLDEDFMPA